MSLLLSKQTEKTASRLLENGYNAEASQQRRRRRLPGGRGCQSGVVWNWRARHSERAGEMGELSQSSLAFTVVTTTLARIPIHLNQLRISTQRFACFVVFSSYSVYTIMRINCWVKCCRLDWRLWRRQRWRIYVWFNRGQIEHITDNVCNMTHRN